MSMPAPLVLVADDEASMVQMLVDFLHAEGYRTVTASDGEETLALCRQTQPDAILLDVRMPKISGFEICKRLRQMPEFSRTPILLITALDNSDRIDLAFEAGATDYVVKPPHLTILHHRLRTLLSARRAEQGMAITNRLLGILNQVSLAVSSTLELDEILARVARISAEAIGTTSAYIWVSDLELRDARVLAEYIGANSGNDENESDVGVVYHFPDPVVAALQQAARTMTPYTRYIDDADIPSSTLNNMKRWSVKSILMVPLFSDENGYGFMELWESRARREFLDEEIALASSIARQASLTIRNARLHAALRESEKMLARRNNVLEKLTAISRAASSSLQLERVLTTIAREMAGALDTTSAYICDCDLKNGITTVLAEYISPEASAEECRSDLGASYDLNHDFPGIQDWLVNPQRSYVFHADDEDAEIIMSPHMKQYGARSVMAIPFMLAPDNPLGFIELWESRRKRQFTPEEIELGVAIARQVSAVIHNAMLHKDLNHYVVELEARNRDLDAFSYTIAHDLKAPLSVITTFSALSKMKFSGEIPPTLAEYLAEIHTAARRLDEMIDQLLYLARLQDAVETTKHVDTNDTVRRVLYRFQLRLDERHIEVDIAPNLPHVLAHTPWVEEIFANLIGNAVKYIGKDNPSPRIEIGGYTEESMAVFFVADNGVGISPENQATMFKMFTRFDRGDEPGFGLGLSIVQRIVTKLGGTIRVESAPDQGTSFYFKLPLFPFSAVV